MRERGRPKGGSVKIRKTAVESLPARGSAHAFAKVLGVSATTMRNWCLMDRLPFTQERGVFVLEKTATADWLVRTQRVEG